MQPDGGDDQSGKVNAGDPVLFTVTVGGKNAQADNGGVAAPHSQQEGGYQRGPPPPPPGTTDGAQDQGQGKSGLGGKLFGYAKGKAKGFMHK